MELSEETFERVYETARALGEETRFRVYRELCRTAPQAVSVGDLADAFSVHPNAIRQHLSRLEQAGLVTSRPHREGGAGRPRRLYRAVTDPLGIGAARPTPGRMLEMLEGAVQELPADRSQLVAFGRAWGRAWADRRRQQLGAPGGSRGRIELLTAELVVWGWEPATSHENGSIHVRTGRCLFDGSAPGRNGRCCALEEGVLAGLVEGILEGGSEPILDGCRLEVRA